MKALDLEVVVNSNGCNDSVPSNPTELTLVQTPAIPTIPSVGFMVTKGSESHEFASFKVIEEWIIEECDDELYEAYRWADHDEKGGCSGMKDWIQFCLSSDELFEFAEAKGWTIERVAK